MVETALILACLTVGSVSISSETNFPIGLEAQLKQNSLISETTIFGGNQKISEIIGSGGEEISVGIYTKRNQVKIGMNYFKVPNNTEDGINFNVKYHANNNWYGNFILGFSQLDSSYKIISTNYNKVSYSTGSGSNTPSQIYLKDASSFFYGIGIGKTWSILKGVDINLGMDYLIKRWDFKFINQNTPSIENNFGGEAQTFFSTYVSLNYKF